MSEILASLVGAPVSIEELKHKPGRRRTLRATGSRRTAIVKLYESDRAPVVAARVAALTPGPYEISIPRVLHLDPVRRMLVLSEVEGTPLRASILSGDKAGCRRVGQALATWHRAWRNISCNGLRPQTIDDEERVLLARTADARPPIAAAVRFALPALTGAWPCTTVVHRDLYEEQILLGERVGLIDLDDAAIGPPELDVGNLLGHIELLELRRERRLGAEMDAILDGYADTGEALDSELLDRCRRLTLLRLACIHDDIRLAEAAAEHVTA